MILFYTCSNSFLLCIESFSSIRRLCILLRTSIKRTFEKEWMKFGVLENIQERLEITQRCEFAQQKFNESQLKLIREIQASIIRGEDG